MTISSNDIMAQNPMPSFTDGDLTIVEQLSELEQYSSGVRMEHYAVALMTHGSASFFVDGESHQLTANDLFVFRPYITLERTMLSADAEYRLIIISTQYTKRLISMSGRSGWDILMYISSNPTIRLTTEQATLFKLFYQLARTKLMQQKNDHYREVIDSLFTAMLYELYDVMETHFKLAGHKFSTSETIFRHFYDILNNTTPKYQKVDYYASQLNITPKYFSSVCKELTGKTALQHITDAVLKDLCLLLKDEQLSIKQIAQIAGFPNQSALGTYTRKHLGASPQKSRERLRRNRSTTASPTVPPNDETN